LDIKKVKGGEREEGIGKGRGKKEGRRGEEREGERGDILGSLLSNKISNASLPWCAITTMHSIRRSIFLMTFWFTKLSSTTNTRMWSERGKEDEDNEVLRVMGWGGEQVGERGDRGDRRGDCSGVAAVTEGFESREGEEGSNIIETVGSSRMKGNDGRRKKCENMGMRGGEKLTLRGEGGADEEGARRMGWEEEIGGVESGSKRGRHWGIVGRESSGMG
jgi:hypothetical protein